MKQNKAIAKAVPLEDYLPYRFSTLAEAMSRRLAVRYIDKHGLTQSEWRVLHVLSHGDALTTQEMIALASLDRVRASRASASLEEKGFLARVTHPRDRRAHLLQLTPRGLRLYEEIAPVAAEVQQFLLDAMTPEEAESLGRVLDKLSRALRVETPAGEADG